MEGDRITKTCTRCGRRARWRWALGRGRWCRRCAIRAGLCPIYHPQAALRFRGRLPQVG